MKLTEKYARLLEAEQLKFCDHEKVAEIIDNVKTIIDDKYIAYPNQHKAGGLYVIVKLYMKNKENFDSEKISEILKKFFKYIDDHYLDYMNSLVIMKSEIDATLTFYIGFINKQ